MTDSFAMRGLDAVSAMLDRVSKDAVLSASSGGMEDGLEAICREAKALCPRDTGTLRDSIQVRLTADGGEVYAGAPYAAAVEMGAAYRPAQPFMFPAFRVRQQEAAACICGAVTQQIRKGEGG